MPPAPVPGDVLGAVRDLGIEIERIEGGEIWARCPMHAARTGKPDRHPSFSVNEASGLFCCLSCGYQGAFATLAMDLLHLEPVAAQAWVARQGSLARVTRVIGRATAAAVAAPPEPSLAEFTFPPPEALHARGIDDDGAARYGLLWDAESGGFVLPIRDATGNLLGYQYKKGRWVRNRPRGIAKATTLFGACIFEGDTAVLVESPLDCARIWAAGYPGAMASFGSLVSDTQIDLLVALADRVVIALDNDEAGRLGAESVHARLRGRVQVRFFRYPPRSAKDPGDLDDEEIGHGITQAYSDLRRRLRGW